MVKFPDLPDSGDVDDCVWFESERAIYDVELSIPMSAPRRNHSHLNWGGGLMVGLAG